MDKTLTMLDLFSGIGGFSYAGQMAGFKTIGFCEKDEFCSKVLHKHWPQIINYGDIRNIRHHKYVDLITGGFPCQPFSVAGKKKGKDDDRYLWPQFFRIIKQSKPAWIIAENVPGIIDMALDNILNDLESEGYETKAFCIPACAIGAPHKRERLWIVANRNSERCNDSDNIWQKRYLQDDQKRDVATIQSEWNKWKPRSWETFNAQDWLEGVADTDSFDDDKRPKFGWKENQPPIPGVDDGLPDIVDRNKSLGNSIVPQVVFPILKFINIFERRTGV